MRFEGIVQPPPGIPPPEPSPDGTIVMRVPNWIGDAVLAIPAVAALADRFADRTVLVLARGGVAPLFVGLPRIHSVVRVADGAGRLASVRRALDGEPPALGIVFPHSFGTAVELAAAGARTLWGYGGPLRKLVLDVALPPRWLAGRHRWEAYALLAAAVTGRPVVERYPLARGSGDVAAADGLFAEAGLQRGNGAGPLVGMVPGAHADSRRWPATRFAELASRLGRRGARVVLFGSAGERDLAARVAAAADPAPIDWSGRTPLPVLAECFRRLDFLVTNDTGPMHLAAAVGTPLLDLCGAANEVVTGPRGTASEVVIHPIHCRPCVKNSCAYNLECMRGIGVDRVEALARSRIEEPVRAANDG